MGQVMLHWTYLEMVSQELEVIRHCEGSEAILQRLIQLQPPPPNREELIDIFVYHYWARRNHSILKTMILSAMALEAYINNVAKQKLSGFDRDSLDKLDLPSKWVIIPKIAFGRGPDAGSDLIARIKYIQKERNFLVHARPMNIPCDGTIKAKPLSAARAEEAWKTCVDAVTKINEIDPTFESGEFNRHVTGRDLIRHRMEMAIRFERNQYVEQNPLS